MSSPILFLTGLLGGIGTSHILIALAIMVSTLFLEDTTVVVVGLLAADGIVSIPLALTSLYAGIIIADTGMFWLGYFASTHPRLGKYVDHDFIAPFRAWLETRFILTVFSARFIPGSRIPTYTASGFFRTSFPKFIATIVTAMAIWTTFLFTISYLFGSISSTWMKEVRWGIAIVLLLALFFVARHNVRTYTAKKNEMGQHAEPHEPATY